MTMQALDLVSPQQTEHPYIVRVEGVCGGRPTIAGTRVSVRAVAELFKAGETVEEMLRTYPHLKPAALYDAISYYLDHQAEIELEIADNRFEALQAKYNLTLDQRGFVHFNERPEAGDEV